MKKRVLFFINGLYGGGAEKVLQTLLKHIDREKFDITLYSLRKENLTDAYPSDLTYRHIFTSWEKGDTALKHLWVKIVNKFILLIYHHFSPRTFYRLFVKGEYDTEVAFMEGYATRIISGSTNPKSRKIAWIHCNINDDHWTTIAYKSDQEEESAYHKFDKILCVSGTVKERLAQLYPSITDAEVCYNPVDEKRIRVLADEPISDTRFLRGKVTFVSIGRLVHQKGYDRLVRIAKQLRDEGFDFSINILGEGSDRPELESYIAQNDLDNHVRLLGFKNNPYPYLNAADVFVCSSRSEGYSTAITEALVLGKAVITTEVSGAREQLGENDYGLITINNEKALYQGIISMLTSECRKNYELKALDRGSGIHLSLSIIDIESKL